jgi:hypothetical protein
MSDAALAEAKTEDGPPDGTGVEFKMVDGRPGYMFGHFDTSVEGFPFNFEMGMFKNGWIPIGDKEDGPILAIVVLGPGIRDHHAHLHQAAQVRLIYKGSMRIGNK